MRDYRKFCRPKTIKNPQSGDYEVTLNCGSTVYVSKDEFEKKTNKYFRNYKEYEETIPNNVIKYTASQKLAEINGNNNGGINTDYINANIVSHTFENGVGIITFDQNITEIIDGGYPGKSVGAFAKSNITSIIIPNSVTSIGEFAFRESNSLTSITIPNSVTSIGKFAFANCSNLSSVTIPDSMTSIGDDVFTACTSLTSVTIPNSVTSIGSSAFQYCSSLTSVTIPESVTSIGHNAFSGCSGLTSVTIPNSVTSVGRAFCANCTNLTSVTVLPVVPPRITNLQYVAIFNNCTSLEHIYVPFESVNAYKAAEEWSTYADKIQAIPEE